MAKLSSEKNAILWSLKEQLLNIIDEARATEFALFSNFGETERTLPFLDEMQNVAQESISRFSQLSNLQVRIANIQPLATPAILEILEQAIAQNQARLPAWERSIQEVKIEWNLP